jgi:amidase
MMSFRRPSAAELVAIGSLDHLELTEDEGNELLPAVEGLLDALEHLATAPSLELPPSPYRDRDPGRPPTRDEDPWNAFTRICDVAGADAGLLHGKTVGIKDNIDVAAVPTSNASATTSYVPTYDAVVVERILAAGGRIVGKLNMDNFAAGASGETSAFGPPLNPVDPSRSPGGSSGGSGSAVASGAVDVALGVDQAGSARIPASFCGVVALMATHGLVPTKGITHLDHTIDFICPMATTVDDAALLLEAIAGDDWRDPQWVRGPLPASWKRGEGDDVRELKVGLVVESLRTDICSDDVVRNTQGAAHALGEAGADVRSVSIPMWVYGLPIVQTLLVHLAGAMIKSEGVGFGHLGAIDVARSQAFAVARREGNRLLPPWMKTLIVVERYLHDEYLNVTYGMTHNLRLRLREDIQRTLAEVDVLLTPTTPDSAPPLLEQEEVASGVASRVLKSLPYNTAPLNLSGNPVLALPSGSDGLGLPTSVQLVGRRFAEQTIVRAGRALEQALSRSR